MRTIGEERLWLTGGGGGGMMSSRRGRCTSLKRPSGLLAPSSDEIESFPTGVSSLR